MAAPGSVVNADGTETVREQVYRCGPRYTQLIFIGEGAYGSVV